MSSALWTLLSFAILAPALLASAQSIPSIEAYFQNAEGTAPQTSILPLPVDLLFDADSYVPPFYLGRALSSPGTTLRLQALARFKQQNGSLVPDSAIIYTWRRNGAVMGAVSGKGMSSVSIASPTLFAADTVSIEARSESGAFYGTASVVIASIDPSITLYENHPLFGVEYYNALKDQSSIPDLEMTFIAVPYFAAASGPSDAGLRWAWSVNGVPVAANATSPVRSIASNGASSNEITINADNSNGLAALAASLTSPVNFLLHAEGSWSVLFSREGAPAKSGQGSAVSGGIFHAGAAQ